MIKKQLFIKQWKNLDIFQYIEKSNIETSIFKKYRYLSIYRNFPSVCHYANKENYHSLHTGANNLPSMCTWKMLHEHQLKNIVLVLKNVNLARFANLSENELSFLLQDKDAENTKKATKVALTLFR